jgi:hypothetical protein
MPPPEPAPLSFQNPAVMKVALTVAVLAALLSWVPILNILLWLAAGYAAVFLYRRRTGYAFSLRAGLRMGWITGVLMFGIIAVLFGGFLALFLASGGVAAFQAQFHNAMDPKYVEALKMLQNGPDVAVLLMQLFIFITCLSMAGGALGAKLVGRD